MERAAIFIDGANVMYQQNYLSWRIDWVKLLHFFSEKYRVVSARYYTALKTPPSEDQKGFHRMLAQTGYSLRTKQLKKIVDDETGDTIYKGNLDIELVIDALTTEDQYDVFILFSGDSDFVPLINALRQQRKIVKAFSTKGFSSIDLVSELGMDFRDIDEYRSRLELKQSDTSRPAKKSNSNSGNEPKRVKPHHAEIGQMPDVGDVFEASIMTIKDYGVFLNNDYNAKVLLHVKNMNIGYVSESMEDIFNMSDKFTVRVEDVDTTETINQVSVSLTDSSFQSELKSRMS